MKTLPMFQFMAYSITKAIRHPKSKIAYYYCSKCNIRFPNSATECPKCHNKIGNSPEGRQESPIPWWGAVVVIVIGITCWIISNIYSIGGLDEAARAMVYIPLGSLFGMSLQR